MIHLEGTPQGTPIQFGKVVKILPAKDALEKTKETHLKAIESYILAAIKKGQTYCEIMPSQQFVSQENKQILKDAGYNVTEKESMAGKEIKISWE